MTDQYSQLVMTSVVTQLDAWCCPCQMLALTLHMPWHAGAVVLNADFYKSTSKNILFEICEAPACHMAMLPAPSICQL